MSKPLQSCYASWTESKTGISLPLYTNGRAAASVYNPEKEALQFAAMDVFKNAGFILIAGLGAQLHIDELVKRYPNSRIGVVEANKASIDFILKGGKKQPDYADIDICTAGEVYGFLLQNYFPPVHGNFCLYPLRSWAQAQPQVFEFIKTETERALQDIAADVSTQARFGKIWHKNIMDNLSLYADMPSDLRVDFSESRFPTDKTAFIAAAGPSLELCFSLLKQKRSSYYIIAADTAFQALNAQGIRADAFVSIDPQHVSLHHIHTHIDSHTLFVCDSACSPLIPRTAMAAGAKILFFKSSHPLCSLAEHYYAAALSAKAPLFPSFGSPEGTVTIAAVNFALKAGFTRIETGGADFCYIGGKAYVRGSYFDSLFGSQSTRLNGAEHLFCGLMYAKELENAGIKNGKVCLTTTLLKSYRQSFETLCASQPGIIFPVTEQNNDNSSSAENIFPLQNDKTAADSLYYCEDGRIFNAQDFFDFYRSELEKLQKGIKTAFSQAVYASLLPLAARSAGSTARLTANLSTQNASFDLHKIIDEILLKFRY